MEDSIISAVTSNIFERCVGATREHLGYIWNYKKNMANLQAQVKKLDEERADKSHSVTVAEKDVQKIKNRVKSWLDEAGKTCEETTEILNDYKEKKRCLMGLCPNFISRYQLSKRACKKETEIVGAIREAGEIKNVSDRAIGLGKQIALSTEGLFTFKSRESVLEDIMKALQDETKNLIGVYGFGGMGKTTLVKQVAARADEEKMFEEIVFAPVTQAVELKKIQEKIASMLDLRLNNSNEAESAGLIHGRLKGKKVLVILDDLWEDLDLNDVGIPSGAEHMSCKILLTSRTLRVLSSMGTKKEFLLGALEEEEAWRLFEEKTIDVIKDPAFFAIGKKVAKRCAGLPVLIVTTAASLSKRPTLPAWNDALKQLKRMDNKHIHEIVNSAMKTISYNHLGKKHRQLFLLCGLVGASISIEHLLQYSWGLDMFDGEVATMGEARNRLHAWILDLKESCLLLDGDNQGDRNSIKMHDVVRDVAISIAEKDFNMLSVEDNGKELTICQKDGVLKRCIAIVFRGCPNLTCLPQQLECPSLELCILSRRRQFGESSFSIPNTFFEKTSNLKVLDMSHLYVSTLPSSLSFLKNIQTFRADYCYSLKDISIVGELKKLQTLSLFASGIEELPSGIGKLFELRLLDLSNCSNLKVIQAGFIAGLSRLEELKMRGGFDRWDAEDGCNNNGLNKSGRTNVSLLELNHLVNLTSLEIEVSNAELLSKDLRFERWEKYEIIGGDMWQEWSFRDWLEELEITRKVCLQLGTTSINHLQHVVEKLFKRTECLCLGELKGVKNVTPELDVDGFPYMKHLRINQDYEIQYIVNVEYRQHKASFPALESLYLSHLLELQKICNGRLMEESFYNLKVLKVENCDQLESLFSFSMAIGLRCLGEIQVSECNVLEAIIAEKNRGDDDVYGNDGVCEKIEFIQLHKLSLKCLPKLNNFFDCKIVSIQKKRQKSFTTNVESEEIVSEEAESESSMPFFRKVSFPKLEELELSGISNLTQMWSHKLSEMPCCNLTRLTVENCDNLPYLLTPSVSMALVGLRDLIVKSCVKMKNIVAEEEGEAKIGAINFPHLSYLCLESLPNFTTFYSRSVEGHPNQNMDTAIQSLFNEKVSFPKLEKLELSKISNSTEIWNHQVPEIPYSNLTTLTVQKCNNLEYLFTPSVTTGLVRLQQLTIQSCARMKHVVAKEERKSKMVTTCFPHLSHLCLQNLSNLTTFNCRIEKMDENDNLQAAVQPFFDEKVELPSLKTLEIGNSDGIKMIWPHMSRRIQSLKMDPPKVLSFQTLERVKVYGCRSLEHVIPAYATRALNKLEELSIQDCGVETIIGDDKDTQFEEIKAAEEATTFTFPKLVKCNLRRLSKLKCFYPREHTTQWPALKELVVSGCDKIQPSMLQLFSSEKVAFSPSMSFKNLVIMEINGCAGLKYLFTPSIAMNLEKVRKLAITNCSMMKAVVSNEEGEAMAYSSTIIFPQLMYLELEDLPKLTRFYSGSVEELDSNEKLDYDAQPLFNLKIQFPSLLRLSIARLDSINSIWQNQKLYQVKEVNITNSTARNQINLKKESPEVFSFQSVKEVTICECKSLEHVFPVSVAQSLKKLEELSIKDCEVLETIIDDENHMENPEEVVRATGQVATTFTFPKLARLKLVKLPKVKCFYPREHTIVWPVLKVLEMRDCGKISAFDFLTIPEEQGDNPFEKVISESDFMSITSQDMIKIARLYDGHIPQHLFRSLRSLTITGFHGEAATFLSKFPGIIRNQLLGFRVYNCSFQEIFPYEGHVNSDVLLPQLRKLELEKLPELKYICKKDEYSTFISVLDKLFHLNVTECPHLMNLVPPSVSFRLLAYLTVTDCGGLINLIEPSTATSLEHLRSLSISGCERVEEIIGEEKELSSFVHEIIFNKLQYLNLEKLPRLKNFSSSRSYTFSFPSLERVYVEECHNMKTFCGGITTSPNLRCVYLDGSGSEERWEGELNATVEQIYAESEAKRLATTLPPTLSSKDLTAARVESRDTTNQEENVAEVSEKGKELRVSKEDTEDCDKYEQAPRYSDPSCSNCTGPEQTVAAYLVSSQHVAASSSQLIPQNSNPLHEVSPSLATQVAAERLATIPSISSIDHDNQAEYRAEQTIEDDYAMNQKENVADTCEKAREQIIAPCLGSSQHVAASSTQLSPPISNLSDGVKASSLATQVEAETPAVTVSATSSNNQFEAEAQCHDKSPKKSTDEPRNGIEEFRREVGTSSEASNSQRKGFQESHVAKDFTPALREFLQILQTQPVDNMSAEQVQFMEHAMEWFWPYLQKSRECLDRNQAISELKLEIAEREMQLQELKEKQKALEDENKATASSIPRFDQTIAS